MTTIIVRHISTNELSYQNYQTREEALAAGKWYVSLKENGTKKYQVIIQKEVR